MKVRSKKLLAQISLGIMLSLTGLFSTTSFADPQDFLPGGGGNATTQDTGKSTGTPGMDRYYIHSVVDRGGFGLMTSVITDNTAGSVLETKYVDYDPIFYGQNVVKKGTTGPKNYGGHLNFNFMRQSSDKSDVEYEERKKNDVYSRLVGDNKTVDGSKGLKKGLVFTFPGYTFAEGSKFFYQSTSKDFERAQLVAETLTKGINDAILFIRNNADPNVDITAETGLTNILGNLSTTARFVGSPSGSFTLKSGNTDFTIEVANQSNSTKNGVKELIPVNNLKLNDYVKITSSRTKNYSFFPYRMEKGYHKGQPMYEYISSGYRQVVEKVEPEYISWGQLILQAMVNSDLGGTTSQDFGADNMTLIGQGLGADLTGTIASVRSMLNLAPIQELILNMGSRTSSHHMGVMTQSMYSTARMVYTIVLAVSMLVLSAMVIRLIHQKMISTTNIVAKTSLMEGLQDIIFVAVMLWLFPFIFELLLEINYWIVRTFGFSSNYLSAYGIQGVKTLSMQSMAGFIVSTMFLSIDVYINAVYLIRAIAVSFLFAISPFMTVSYLWGPMQKRMYFSYIRELVGNIFMQSFHAITMTFFSGYNQNNLSSMEAIASAYCFIPLTQLFRQLVIGNSGGFSETTGGKLAGQLTNMAVSGHKSKLALKQGYEMMNKQAETGLVQSMWNVTGQTVGTIGNVMGTQMLQNSSNEIGAKGLGGAPKGGSGKSGIGKAGAVGAGLNVLGAGMSTTAGVNAQKELGKLQMEHSMQNMNAGLVQAGVGLGTSSFDNVGATMVNTGMGTVEGSARAMGAGSALSGNAGGMQGVSAGIDNSSRVIMSGVGPGLKAGYAVKDAQNKANQDYQRYEKMSATKNLGFNQEPIKNDFNIQHRDDNTAVFNVNENVMSSGKYRDSNANEHNVTGAIKEFSDLYKDVKNGNSLSPKMETVRNRLMNEYGWDGSFRTLKEGNITTVKINVDAVSSGLEKNVNGAIVDKMKSAGNPM